MARSHATAAWHPPRDVGTRCLSRPFRLAGRRVTALILASDQVTKLIRDPGQRGFQHLTKGPSRAPYPQVLQKARTQWWWLVSNSRGGPGAMLGHGVQQHAPHGARHRQQCPRPPPGRHGAKPPQPSVTGMERKASSSQFWEREGRALGGFPQQSVELEDQSN